MHLLGQGPNSGVRGASGVDDDYDDDYDDENDDDGDDGDDDGVDGDDDVQASAYEDLGDLWSED